MSDELAAALIGGNNESPETTAAPSSDTTQTPATGQNAPAWADGLNDDIKAVIGKKGWKNPEDAIKSYAELEKHLGADKSTLLRVPKDENDAEGFDGLYKALGRPDNPDDYKLAEVWGEDMPLAPNFAGAMQETFHKAGLSPKQAEVMAQSYKDAAMASIQQQTQANQEALRAEWGQQYDTNVKYAQRALQTFGPKSGIAPDEIQAFLGANPAAVPQVAKIMAAIGREMGEDAFINSSSSSMTPESAQRRINSLMSDEKFREALMRGQTSETQIWDELNQAAAGVSLPNNK